jgi:hypothetical protein
MPHRVQHAGHLATHVTRLSFVDDAGDTAHRWCSFPCGARRR